MSKFQNRESTYPISEFLLSRTSSRAFGKRKLSDEELLSLFEAARWAPSSYNNQPWRFVYTRQGDPEWDIFFEALVDANKAWCKNADTLVVILSKKTFDHNNKLSTTASFDTGAAWMNLALEAHAKGLVAHGLEGFHYDKIKQNLNISDDYKVEAMVAIGSKGDSEGLSEALKEKEKPTMRKPLEAIVSRGKFDFNGH